MAGCCGSFYTKASMPTSTASGCSTASWHMSPAPPGRRFQRALCEAQRAWVLRGNVVSLSRSRAARPSDRQDRRSVGKPHCRPATEDLLHQLIDRILGRRTRCGAHPHDDRRPGRRARTRQRTHLPVRRHPACAGWLPCVARSGGSSRQTQSGCFLGAARSAASRFDRWVRDGVTPPASRHPRLSDETLLPRTEARFPGTPGRALATDHSGTSYRADLAGLPAQHPLPFLVPNVDRDGNEVAGIQLPDQAVPLATYTGWNFRSPGHRPAGSTPAADRLIYSICGDPRGARASG